MASQAPVPAPAPDDSPPARIVVQRLSKTFQARSGPVEALQGVDLVIPDGQFCCIVGPSGCGKTTLLRILAGLEDHSDGRLEMLHTDPRRPLTSMVFQEQSIFPWMTVQDNVAYGPRMRGLSDRESRELVDYYIDKVGLTQFQRAYPHQLSGGMKQRVSVARAFANAPEILLMDEPFAALEAAGFPHRPRNPVEGGAVRGPGRAEQEPAARGAAAHLGRVADHRAVH